MFRVTARGDREVTFNRLPGIAVIGDRLATAGNGFDLNKDGEGK